MSTKIVQSLKFSTNLLKQQVKRSFLLHRDLKSCITLEQLQTLFQSRRQEINMYGKTALLQTLNNFSLNHSKKSIRKHQSMKVFMDINKLTNLTRYQQMLKYSIFVKISEKMAKQGQKRRFQQIVQLQQKQFIEKIVKNPFDTVDAMLFMIFQKQTSSDDLFYHSLGVLQNSNYDEIHGVLVKMMPSLLKRLTINQWQIFRRFDYLLDILAYSYIPQMLQKSAYLFILNQISKLQLHIVGYAKMPPAIDIIFNIFLSQKQKQKSVKLSHLISLFESFKYMPLNYNQKAYDNIYNQILSRSQIQPLHYDSLPYRRMSLEQIQKLYVKYLNDQTLIIKALLFSGNNIEFRTYFQQFQTIEKLINMFFRTQMLQTKTVVTFIVSAHILLNKYKNTKKKKQIMLEKFMQMIRTFNQSKNIVQNYRSFFNMSNCLNFFQLAIQSQQSDLYWMANYMKKSYLIQLSSTKPELYHFNMLLQAVKLHSQNSHYQIRTTMIKFVQIVCQESNKLHFHYFSIILFELLKSTYANEYQNAINILMKSIRNEQLWCLVEIFNGYQHKNFRLKTKLIDAVWQKEKSFKSIGKFMISSTFKFFTSNRGELTLDMRPKLQYLQPIINFEDMSNFLLNEINYIIRFCTNFFYYISNFARKVNLILMKNIKLQQYTKQGLNVYISFIDQSVKLLLISQNVNKYQNVLINFIQKTKEFFEVNTFFKAKQIQWRSVLKKIDVDQKQILLDQLLSDLSNNNYDPKEYNTLVLIIKMNLMGVIELNQLIKDKIEYVVSTIIDQNVAKAFEIIRLLSVKYYKLAGLNPKQQNLSTIQATLMKCLGIKNKQGAQYYLQYAELAYQLNLKMVLKVSLQELSSLELTANEIKQTLKYLRQLKGFNSDKIYSKLLVLINKNTQPNNNSVLDILFYFFKSRISISSEQQQLTEVLIKESQRQIDNIIKIKNDSEKADIQKTNFFKSQNKNLIRFDETLQNKVIKHMFVCCLADKLNTVNEDYFLLFVNFVVKRKLDENIVLNKQISNKQINLLFFAVIKHIQENQTSLLAKVYQSISFDKRSERSFFNMNNPSENIKSDAQIIKYLTSIISERMIKNQQSSINYQKLIKLQQFLTQKGYKKKNVIGKSNQKVYLLNHICKNVKLHVYIRTQNNQQIGILYLDDWNCMSQKKQVNGKGLFMVRCYEIICGFKIIAYQEEKQIILQ